jgi:hypothetical protein
MRKQTRRSTSPSGTDKKRVLQLTQETVRTLSSEQLSHAVAAECPMGSHPTSIQENDG